MEHLNKIELIGTVGTVRTAEMSGITMARFTVATNSAYTNRLGEQIVETSWFNVVAYESKTIRKDDLLDLASGCGIRVIGRLRQINLADGNRTYEVAANELFIVKGI